MVQGYTRQAVSNIQPGLTANAEDINNELNQVQLAFDNTQGHDHSGSTPGSGGKVNLSIAGVGIVPVVNGGTGDSALGGILSNPNKLINPFIEIDQANEGTSIAPTSSATLPNAYVVDGWRTSFHTGSSAVVTAQQVSDAPTGYIYSIKYVVTTGGAVGTSDFLSFMQPIEQDNILDTGFGTNAAQNLILTFWLKTSIAGTFGASIWNGSLGRFYCTNIVVTSANTWQKFSISIPPDQTGAWTLVGSAVGMWVIITASAGSTYQGTANTWTTGTNGLGTSSMSNVILATTSATFQLSICKLEVSSVATPIYRESSAVIELIRCQRYFEKSYSFGTKAGTATTNGQYGIYAVSGGNAQSPVRTIPKASIPVVSIYSPLTGTVAKVSNGSSDVAANSSSVGANQFIVQTTSSLGANTPIIFQWTADARL